MSLTNLKDRILTCIGVAFSSFNEKAAFGYVMQNNENILLAEAYGRNRRASIKDTSKCDLLHMQ